MHHIKSCLFKEFFTVLGIILICIFSIERFAVFKQQLCAMIWSTYLGHRNGFGQVCVCVVPLDGGVKCGMVHGVG